MLGTEEPAGIVGADRKEGESEGTAEATDVGEGGAGGEGVQCRRVGGGRGGRVDWEEARDCAVAGIAAEVDGRGGRGIGSSSDGGGSGRLDGPGGPQSGGAVKQTTGGGVLRWKAVDGCCDGDCADSGVGLGLGLGVGRSKRQGSAIPPVHLGDAVGGQDIVIQEPVLETERDEEMCVRVGPG